MKCSCAQNETWQAPHVFQHDLGGFKGYGFKLWTPWHQKSGLHTSRGTYKTEKQAGIALQNEIKQKTKGEII